MREKDQGKATPPLLPLGLHEQLDQKLRVSTPVQQQQQQQQQQPHVKNTVAAPSAMSAASGIRCPLAESSSWSRKERQPEERRAAPLILCDMAYGIPNEARPRKEKLLAMARQLINFLQWQQQQQQQRPLAEIQVVACPDQNVCDALEARMLQLWQKECHEEALPVNFSISTRPLEEWLLPCCTGREEREEEQTDKGHDNMITATIASAPKSPPCLPVYLSPDAAATLDATIPPPRSVVVGLLIDRKRIQVNRSCERAVVLDLPMRKWPLHLVSDVLHPNEPLNVDCVLEGMQQWYWNEDTDSSLIGAADRDGNEDAHHSIETTTSLSSQARTRHFHDAVIQALQHHQQRHPARPQHLEN